MSLQQTEVFAKLYRLRVDRSRGNAAPHKPLLLLVLCDLADEGLLDTAIVSLNGVITFRFLTYWSVVSNRRRHKPDIRLPFYHLQSSGLWTPLDKSGMPTTDRKRVAAAQLSDDFHLSLCDPSFRMQLRHLLIERFFELPTERHALSVLTGMPLDSSISIDEAVRLAVESTCREAKFRLTVVPAYSYQCALTGYRMVTRLAGAIVDAAHIHRFADSRNNDPTNGVALCKNAHWMFDQGLWTVDESLRILVAGDAFDETGQEPFLLRSRHGQDLLLPLDVSLRPKLEYFNWHRKNVFLG